MTVILSFLYYRGPSEEIGNMFAKPKQREIVWLTKLIEINVGLVDSIVVWPLE